MFFKLTKLDKEISLPADRKEAWIRQWIEIESERAATLFISQHIDGVELVESTRYLVEKGGNRIELRPMRIIHPRIQSADGSPACYRHGVSVFAAGLDMLELSEECALLDQ